MNPTMNPADLSPEALDRLARKRASAKLGWYVHATIYVVVNLGLLLASHHGLGHRPWSLFPALGWGLGLLLHGAAVFLLGQGSSWRESLVERERERIRRSQRP